jgi:hypothetical protein
MESVEQKVAISMEPLINSSLRAKRGNLPAYNQAAGDCFVASLAMTEILN